MYPFVHRRQLSMVRHFHISHPVTPILNIRDHFNQTLFHNSNPPTVQNYTSSCYKAVRKGPAISPAQSFIHSSNICFISSIHKNPYALAAPSSPRAPIKMSIIGAASLCITQTRLKCPLEIETDSSSSLLLTLVILYSRRRVAEEEGGNGGPVGATWTHLGRFVDRWRHPRRNRHSRTYLPAAVYACSMLVNKKGQNERQRRGTVKASNRATNSPASWYTSFSSTLSLPPFILAVSPSPFTRPPFPSRFRDFSPFRSLAPFFPPLLPPSTFFPRDFSPVSSNLAISIWPSSGATVNACHPGPR